MLLDHSLVLLCHQAHFVSVYLYFRGLYLNLVGLFVIKSIYLSGDDRSSPFVLCVGGVRWEDGR